MIGLLQHAPARWVGSDRRQHTLRRAAEDLPDIAAGDFGAGLNWHVSILTLRRHQSKGTGDRVQGIDLKTTPCCCTLCPVPYLLSAYCDAGIQAFQTVSCALIQSRAACS